MAYNVHKIVNVSDDTHTQIKAKAGEVSQKLRILNTPEKNPPLVLCTHKCNFNSSFRVLLSLKTSLSTYCR